jgi:hypothetical protein
VANLKEECKKAVLDANGFMDSDLFDTIEQDILDIQNAHKGDAKGERKAIMKYVEDSEYEIKYKSKRILEDMIKTQKALVKVTAGGNWKQAKKNFHNFFNGDNSIESSQLSLYATYDQGFTGTLKDKGVHDLFVSGKVDGLIHEQIYNRANNKPDVSNPDVVKIADTIKQVNDRIHADMNNAGLSVKYRRDYSVPQHWDADIIRSTSLEDFTVAFKRDVDLKKTFAESVLAKGEEGINAAIEDMHTQMGKSTNVWNTDDLMGKLSYKNKLKSRKIEFNDGKTQHNFLGEFGRQGYLYDAFRSHMHNSSKLVPNTMAMGTNPGNTWDRLLKSYGKTFHAKGISSDDITKAIGKAQEAYLDVVAPVYTPSGTADRMVNGLRALTTFKLGSSVFTAAYDINSTALHATVNSGMSQAESYFRSFQAFAKTLKKEQRDMIAQVMNTQQYFIDSGLAMGYSKGDFETGFDMVTKATSMFHKWTGVPLQTQLSRLSGALVQGNILKKIFNSDFAKLNDFELAGLKRYGISEADHALINKNVKGTGGMIGAGHVAELDGKLFDANPIKAARMKQELYMKMSNYVNDAVLAGTPTPRSKTRVALLKSRGNNSPEVRMASNLITQFKETALKIAMDNVSAYNKISDIGGAGRANREVMAYMTMGFVSYYLIENAKRLLYNKPTLDQEFAEGGDGTFKKLFFDYLNRSSVLPLVTDGAEAGLSKSPFKTLSGFLAGPNVAALGDTMQLAGSTFMPSRSTDLRKEGGRFLKRHIVPSSWLPVKAL